MAPPHPGAAAASNRSTLVNIQALRAAAAFLVVFVHLQVLAARMGVDPHFLEFGNAGVDIFFVISGFIMVLTTSQRQPSAADFFAARVVRIVPFYWLVTLAVFAIAVLAPQLLNSTRADPGELMKSLFFFPFRRSTGLVEPVVFVGWTLNYEMAFYLLFALGLTLRNRSLGLGLTLLALACAAAGGWAVHPTGVLAAFYSSPIILEFALGMLIGAMAARLPPLGLPPAALLAAMALMLVLILAGPELWPHLDRLPAAGLPGAVLVFSAVELERSGWVVRQPLLRKLGDASFATYLTHFFVTQAVTKAAEALHVQARPELVALCAALFVGVALTGLAVHQFVEAPLSRTAKALLQVRRTAPPIPEAKPGSTGDYAV